MQRSGFVSIFALFLVIFTSIVKCQNGTDNLKSEELAVGIGGGKKNDDYLDYADVEGINSTNHALFSTSTSANNSLLYAAQRCKKTHITHITPALLWWY